MERVGDISHALLREYLKKGGYHRTLADFESEAPRTESTISSRSQLARELGIIPWLRRNQKEGSPFSSVIEVIVNEIVRQREGKPKPSQTQATSSKGTASGNIFHQRSRGVPREKQVAQKAVKRTGIDRGAIGRSEVDSRRPNTSMGFRQRGLHDRAPPAKPRTGSNRMFGGVRGVGITSSSTENVTMEDIEFSDDKQFEVSDFDAARLPASTTGGGSAKQHSRLLGAGTHRFVAGEGLGGKVSYGRVEVQALKRVLFGPAGSHQDFIPGWVQGFVFADEGAESEGHGCAAEMAYNLFQRDGGPCGVLAAVQAGMIACLLAEKCEPKAQTGVGGSEKGEEFRSALLARAMAAILWRCGQQKGKCHFLHRNHRASVRSVHGDGGPLASPEGYTVVTLESETAACTFIKAIIGDLRAFDGYGVILFTLSCVLSRGIEEIRMHDFDCSISGGIRQPFSNNSLLASHGYCGQELVNLMLAGRATGNVFDNERELPGGDRTILQGVHSRNSVGYLTYLQVLGHLEVGKNLTLPKLPVWIVYHESHYTVLHSSSLALAAEWAGAASPPSLPVDLCFYDQQGRQFEEITLRLSQAASKRLVSKEDPFLEALVLTIWPYASVEWFGSEPLL